MFTMRAMKTHPSAQPLGFFDLSACGHAQADVELRVSDAGGVQWLAAAQRGLSACPAQAGGHRVDQPDLSRHGGSKLRIPIPNRDCHPDLIGT